MIRGFITTLTLVLLLVAHVVVLGKTSAAWNALPRGDSATYVVMPSQLLKVVSLEFDGLVSDYLFMKTMVFFGEKLEKNKSLKLSEQEWKWIYHILDVSSDMDPYFSDPYYVANAHLTWDAGMVREANILLEKGSRARDWDWIFPFFIGFNYFYFLQDNAKASEYLMEASRRPGGDPMLASIAARLAYKENRAETAIYFLEETAKKTEDKSLKNIYENRVLALRSILFLNKAVTLFEKKFGRAPENVNELVGKKIIRLLPQDPYGGEYYIAKDGRVRSTTSSELEPYLSPSQKARR